MKDLSILKLPYIKLYCFFHFKEFENVHCVGLQMYQVNSLADKFHFNNEFLLFSFVNALLVRLIFHRFKSRLRKSCWLRV